METEPLSGQGSGETESWWRKRGTPSGRLVWLRMMMKSCADWGPRLSGLNHLLLNFGVDRVENV